MPHRGETKCTAIIDFYRLRLSNDRPPAHPISVWVDCARIGQGYYLIGGCNFTDVNGLAQLRDYLADSPDCTPGVRSKVVQALSNSTRNSLSLPYSRHSLPTPLITAARFHRYSIVPSWQTTKKALMTKVIDVLNPV